MKPANRTEARAWWKRVAEGQLEAERYDSVDLAQWLQEVARDVLEADDLADAKKRPYALTKAVGLAKREMSNPKLRELLDDPALDFPVIDEVTGAETYRTQAQLVAEVAAKAEQLGLLRGVYAEGPKAAKDLIRSLVKERKPKNV